MPVQKQQGMHRLILCRDTDTLLHSKVRKKGGDFRLAKIARMAAPMEKNEPANPITIRLLGVSAVMHRPEPMAYAFQKTHPTFRLRTAGKMSLGNKRLRHTRE